MDQVSAQQAALKVIEQKGWSYHRVVSCERLSKEWIEFVTSVCTTLPSHPDELWEVRVQMSPPSDCRRESHGILSILVDGRTGTTAVYPA